MDKILRVNMTNNCISEESLPQKYRLLGGRGLTSAILLNEVNPSCDPLGENNKLVLAAGLLAGTHASSTNRFSVGAKSPLTGGIKESNGGGMAALLLAQQGYRAIIVEGKPSPNRLFTLVIGEGPARLERADNIERSTTSLATEQLLKLYGNKATVVLIGPAGEMQLSGAGIAILDKDNHPGRFCARGGLGAVMGAKGLKAVVILKSKGQRTPLDEGLWKKSLKEYCRTIKASPISKVFPLYGTSSVLAYANQIGGLPTRNFSEGTFEDAENITGEKLYQLLIERGGEGTPGHGCMTGCMVRCSNRFAGIDGKLVVSPMEYENNVLLGSNLGIGNFDTIANLNWLCNELGIDTIETGAAIGVAMEAGKLSFGDEAATLDLIKQVGQGTDLGRLIGQGVVATAKGFGVKRVPAVMGQAIPAYDPRGFKGNGVTYATSPMGADHTAGNTMTLRDINHHDQAGKADISRTVQLRCALIDTLGLCLFLASVYVTVPEAVIGMVNALHGTNLDENDLQEIGKQVIANELEFNKRAGLNIFNQIPEFMKHEPLPPQGSLWDIPDSDLAAVWKDL